MPLTKDELLKPRIKCIVDYPGNIFGVDEILQFTNKADKEFSFTEEWFFVKDGVAWGKTFFDQYPKIFQPLPWHSDRKPEDIPEFVKDDEGKVFRPWDVPSDDTIWGIRDQTGWEFKKDCIPATEEEYTAYINQKQNNNA